MIIYKSEVSIRERLYTGRSNAERAAILNATSSLFFSSRRLLANLVEKPPKLCRVSL